MLQLNNVEVVYDRTILVLRGVSLEVPTGQIVALLGSNGAGKSTTLKTISGILRPQRGEVTAGAVEFDGLRIDHWEPADIVKRGIAQVMEGRRVFEHLTAQENLISGAHTRRDTGQIKQDLELVYDVLPTPEGTPGGESRLSVWRRAANARHWSGAHVASEAHAAR